MLKLSNSLALNCPCHQALAYFYFEHHSDRDKNVQTFKPCLIYLTQTGSLFFSHLKLPFYRIEHGIFVPFYLVMRRAVFLAFFNRHYG